MYACEKSHIKSGIFPRGLRYSLATGNWEVERKGTGVAQVSGNNKNNNNE